MLPGLSSRTLNASDRPEHCFRMQKYKKESTYVHIHITFYPTSHREEDVLLRFIQHWLIFSCIYKTTYCCISFKYL